MSASARAGILMRRARRAAVCGAAALGLLGARSLLGPAALAGSLHVGQPAPAATLVTLDGHHIRTQDLRGRVVILTFWATWCEPCREELPLLSAYAQSHAAQGLTILAFSLDTAEDLPKVRRVAQSLAFPSGLLADSSVPGYGRIWRIPVSFTIDRQGRLVDNGWKDRPPTWTAERLERIVTPLLSARR
ncbi:MAG TPA: TlpA disulfide reductase family protein [Steroidobacteraceae bacterium]